MDNKQGPSYNIGDSAQCYVVAWMGGEFGEEWIHVHVWLSPFAAPPKTTPVLLNQLYSNKKQKV